MSALSAFFAVIIMGTLWRLITSHFIASKNPTLVAVGKAMAFQY